MYSETESIFEDSLLVFNIMIVIFAIIIQVLAVIHVRLKWSFPKRTDKFKQLDFIFFALQVWDLTSDILFGRVVYRKYLEDPNTKTFAFFVSIEFFS